MVQNGFMHLLSFIVADRECASPTAGVCAMACLLGVVVTLRPVISYVCLVSACIL